MDAHQDYIRSYLELTEVSIPLRRRVIFFYERLWQGKVVFDARKIVSGLPECLRSQIAKELFTEMGVSVALFSKVSRV